MTPNGPETEAAQAPSLEARLAATLGRLLGPDFPPALGLAVSGGGDSMAMLHLVAGWARPMGIALKVATIDHGLRPESTDEARMVADEAAGLGLSHDTLIWDDRPQTGNLMQAAREARLALLGQWRGDVGHILMAHTADDVAETFLMRLARGSGVEGLSAMAETREVLQPFVGPDGPPQPRSWRLVRPLINVTRAELRHYAKTLRIPYIDDPSNEDPRFERARMRKALTVLAELGIDQTGLTRTAKRLSRARAALEQKADDALEQLMRPDLPLSRGDVWLDRDGFAAFAGSDNETALRLLARALQHVASNPLRPREAPLEAALDRILSGGTAVLHGVMVVPKGDRIFVFRELKALEGVSVAADSVAVFDGRWVFSIRNFKGLTVSCLGEAGLSQIPTRPGNGAPRALLASKPAIWDSQTLVACPALGFGPETLVFDLAPVSLRFVTG